MKVKKNNFKEKIRRIFLRYAIIPILLLLLLFPLFLFVAERIRIVINTNEASKKVSELFREVYQSYYQEIEQISESDIIKDFIERKSNSSQVYELFYKFNNQQKVKSIFHIIDKDGVVLASTVLSNPYLENIIYKDIVPRIKKTPTTTLTEANRLKYNNDRYTVYSFGRAILKDSEIIAYIIYQLDEKELQELIFVQNVEITVITDEFDRIITTTSDVVRGLMNKFIPEKNKPGKYVEISGGKYYINDIVLEDIPIYVYSLVSNQFNFIVFVFYGLFVVFVGLLLWIIMCYLANKISSENTRSIDRLLHAVYELQEGKLDSYVKVNSGDEFEILADQYNIMLDRLNELIKRNEELLNIRRIKEIKLLQAHFNPHFMFNILETLRYTIVLNQKEALDIIITLSRLLRYSMRDEGQDVLFKKDLAYIEDYLKLHKIRFKERLTYTIDVSEEVKNTSVPKLLLQGIIENSIKYGYKMKRNLHIELSGFISDGKIIFQVKDNGGGMSGTQLNYIQQVNNQSRDDLNNAQNDLTHYGGLYNTHRRLVLLYGEEYGIDIESNYGVGTQITLTLPHRG